MIPQLKMLAYLTVVYLSIASLCYSLAFSQVPQWRLAAGTSGLRVGAIDVFLSNPDTMYALSDEGILISSNNGELWDTLPGLGLWAGFLSAIKVDPLDSKRIYVSHESIFAGSNDLRMTTNGGVTWELINLGGGIGSGAVVEIDPSDYNIVYAGVGSGTSTILRTTDRGASWSFRPNPVESSIYSLAIDPDNSARLYIAYSAGLFKSLDTGSTWSPMTFGFPIRNDVRLAIHPVSRAIYATFWPYLSNSGGVFRSTDQGLTWNEMNSGLGPNNRHIFWIVINHSRPDQMFLCTSSPTSDPEDLMFTSSDAGFSWIPFANGLPRHGHAEMAVIDTASGKIFAAIVSSGATGVYILDLPTEVREEQKIPTSFNLLQNFPNPFNPSTEFNFDLPDAGNVSLVVYDILGRQITELVHGVFEVGSHSATWNATDQASGVYLVRFSVSDGTRKQVYSKINKLVLMK